MRTQGQLCSGFQLVELDTLRPRGPIGFDGTTLVDSTGSEIPVEILYKGKESWLQDSAPGKFACFLAAAVPALGYKLYAIKPSAKERAAPVDIRGNILENEFYRVTLDPSSGAIASVFDKQLGRELVDSSSPCQLCQYVTGGDSYPENSPTGLESQLKP